MKDQSENREIYVVQYFLFKLLPKAFLSISRLNMPMVLQTFGLCTVKFTFTSKNFPGVISGVSYRATALVAHLAVAVTIGHFATTVRHVTL